MRQAMVIATVMLACATSAFGWVNLEAVCASGQAQIALRIGNTYGPEFTGLVVTRYQMGTCEIPVVVTDAPIPLPPASEEMRVNVTVLAPGSNVFYRFEAQLVDAAGGRHGIPYAFVHGIPQEPRDLAADGDAVVIRGRLSAGQYWAVYIAPCADGCWGDQAESYLLSITPNWTDPLYWYAISGEIVDIIGTFVEYDGTLSPHYHINVETVQLAPAGSCGAVAAESVSWGSLKAVFR